MNRSCKKIEKLIYLYRDGELSDRQSTVVANHINSCPGCQALLADLEIQGKFLNEWKKTADNAESPTSLTTDIVNSVRLYRNIRQDSVLDRLLDVFTIPQIQLGAVFTLLLLVVVLVVQESHVMSKVAGLEQKMDRQSQLVAGQSDFFNQKILQYYTANKKEKINNIIVKEGRDFVIVDKEALARLLEEHQQLLLQKDYLESLLEKNPEWSRLMEKDTLKFHDLQSLNKINGLLKSL